MNIAFDAKRLYNNNTGLGNHSRTTIDILTEYFPENAYFLYTPKVSKNVDTERFLSKTGCVTRMPEGMMKGSLWRTFGLSDDVKNDKIDLFHGLSNELPIGMKVPTVVTIHDVAFRTFPDMYHWIDRQIYDLKWRYACKNADRIIAISECTKKDIVDFYGVSPDKIDVVYQPVGVRYYDDLIDSPQEKGVVDASIIDGDFMLYVGSVNSRKNLLGAVKALELLPKDIQIPLLVVGGGRGYKAEVERYVAEHHLERLVVSPNRRIGDDELQTLYRKARAFVYPSFYEGFGLPVVEALLSGCPVITSNVSSLPEAGGPYSLKVDPNSVDDIAEKMKQVLCDNALQSKMKSKGRQWAMDTFHPKMLAKRIIDVYQSVLM